ncbi:MAG: hypothetical protein ACREE2_02310 [Stellaceae bacterium]
MTGADWRGELRSAVIGSLRLARGDRRGLACFERTEEGFWRSFAAGVLCYPFYLVLLALRVTAAQRTAAGAVPIVLVETIAYVIAWVAFPLIMLSVVRWIGRDHRFYDFMVPYNWCQLPQSVLFVLVGLDQETGFLGDPITQIIELAAGIAVLVYEWYIARVALETNGGAATLVVVIDLVLGLVVSRTAGSLY